MSRHWYNNGIKLIFIEGNPPDNSYVPGMLLKTKEKMRLHEFTLEHRDNLSKSLKNKKRNGVGFSKGHIPWNKGGTSWSKGLTKDSDIRILEASKKISLSRIGKIGTNKGKKFSLEHKEKIRLSKLGKKLGKLSDERKEEFLRKSYQTRLKNNSFNISKDESILLEELKELYPNHTIYRLYKDLRYPFACDFYILEKDLFIELNKCWTHGGKPFDPNDEECQLLLMLWQEKAKTSKFYLNAIYTWTDLDVRKLKIAKENNLNYLVIY